MGDSEQFLDQHRPGALRLGTSQRHTLVARALRLELLDSEGEPLVGEPYRVHADEVEVARGRLGDDGTARVLALCKADYRVSFPELRDDTWDREHAEASEPGDVDDQPYLVQRAETLQMILYRERGALVSESTMAARRNELLFKTRAPAVLSPGDQLYLPKSGQRGAKRRSLTVGETGHFRTTGRVRKLRLTLKEKGEPLAGASYTIEIADLGFLKNGTSDAEGVIETRIPFGAGEAKLKVKGRERTLVLGGLDPLHTVTGIQARLSNLGFHTGAVDGQVGPATRRAIRKFQASRSLLVDGIVGPKTREALASAHGE